MNLGALEHTEHLSLHELNYYPIYHEATLYSMPPPTRNNQFGNYGPVLASLWQVLSLIVNLLYLKLLDGIDFVCVCTGPHPCLARAINKTEERIIYHFLTMIPDSSYKPRVRVTRHIYYPDRVEEIVGNCEPNQTPVLQSSTANNQNGARNSANLSPLMEVSPSISPAVCMSQGLSDGSNLPSTDHVQTDSGTVDSVLPATSSSGSHYSLSGASPRSRSPERNRSEVTTASHAVMSASQFSNMVGTPNFSSPSRQSVAEDENQSGDQLPRTKSQIDKLLEEAGELHRTQSAESYPGKFPVSDGLDYSSLASAMHQMRGKGTTSVRPLSDV